MKFNGTYLEVYRRLISRGCNKGVATLIGKDGNVIKGTGSKSTKE